MSDVTVTVSAQTDGVSTGLAKAQESVNAFKQSATAGFEEIGAAVKSAFGPLALALGAMEAIKSLAEGARKIAEQAEKFGVSAETIQRVGNAAQKAGTDFETVSKELDKITIAAAEANSGNETLAEQFTVLGINSQDFVNLSMEDKLKALAEGYDKSGRSAEGLEARQKLLGRSFEESANMINKGSEALDKSLHDGIVASDEAIANVKQLTDLFVKMWQTVKGLGMDAIGLWFEGWKVQIGAAEASAAYVMNLIHGTTSAAAAAKAAWHGVWDMPKEDKPDDGHGKNLKDTFDAKEYSREGNEAKKRSVEELGKLQEENAKKEEEARMRHLSLLDREKELQKQISDAKGELQMRAALAPGDSIEQEQAKKRLLDAQKGLEENGKAKDVEHRKELENAKRIAEAKKRYEDDIANLKYTHQEESAQKDLENAKKKENLLKEASHERNKVSVDELRSIGGGHAGVNYQGREASAGP